MRINTPEVVSLVKKAFPEYNGRRISVEPFHGPMAMNSYWSGGSRDYWAIVNMVTGQQVQIQENGTPWNPGIAPLQALPVNAAIVRHGCGPYESVTVYVNPENLNRYMLPDSTELTRDQKIVLSATRGLKSSYAGIKNYRFSRAASIASITLEQWETAKAELISSGHLNKAGAITDDGRNAIGRTDLYELMPTARVLPELQLA